MAPVSLLPAETDRVVISVNPKAGADSAWPKAQRLASLLGQRGFQVEILADLSQIADLANRYHEEGVLRALVGAGGDGTAAELLNRTKPGVPLSLLPLGTENLLAKHYGLGPTPEALCQTIAAGSVLHLDAGSANGRLFLLMASCGFDADVVERLHRARGGHIRHWSYAKPIFEAVRSYEYPELKVTYTLPDCQAGDSSVLVARWVFLFNLPCYARGLPLAPEADGADGLLDLCTFREGSLWHGMRYLAAVTLGRHRELADCTGGQVRQVRIESERKTPYQLDGDPGGFLPLDVETLPGRITLVVPPAVSEKYNAPRPAEGALET